jgi:hypothetical protein
MTVGTSDGDGGVVAHDLSADHGKSFALSRVDFARHN